MDALQETLVVVTVKSVVTMVTMASVMVGVMFMVVTMVLPGFSFFVQRFLRMKHDGIGGIRHRQDVDSSRPGHCKISFDEWHAKCVAEGVGQA